MLRLTNRSECGSYGHTRKQTQDIVTLVGANGDDLLPNNGLLLDTVVRLPHSRNVS
jgi:hypothetical protein